MRRDGCLADLVVETHEFSSGDGAEDTLDGILQVLLLGLLEKEHALEMHYFLPLLQLTSLPLQLIADWVHNNHK